jgi:hypothetical protein
MNLQLNGDRTRREDPNTGKRPDGFRTEDPAAGEGDSGDAHGASTNKISFLFDPDYYANWSGRRTGRFSYTDKAITLVILLLATLNLLHFIYGTHEPSQIFTNSPLSIFGFFTIFILCIMMGINSEKPGKFKQLSITTFSMWLLSLVLISGAIIVIQPIFNLPFDMYIYLPALSGLIAFALIGASGIVYIFNTINSIMRLRRLTWGILGLGLFGVGQYIFGPLHIDDIYTNSMPLIPAFIFLLAGAFLNIVSKKVSALYKVPQKII